MPVALTRLPCPALADCQLTFVERQPIDHVRALAQHAAYRALLEELGYRVVALAARDDLPDSVFVEDAAIVLDEAAIVPRMGNSARRLEAGLMAQECAKHRPLLLMDGEGRLDGGDVFRVGKELYAGRSSRTDDAGIAELARLTGQFGYAVHAVEVKGALHLKTAVTPLDDATVLLNPAWVDPAALVARFDVIEVDPAEPFAANALRTAKGVVLPANSPKTIAKVRALGFNVIEFDQSELAKAEAGLTCMSVLID
jgi:dimethylargininase